MSLKSKIKTVYEDNYLPVVSPYFIPDSVVITGNDLLIKDLDILEVSHTDVAIKDTLVIKHIDLVELYPDIKVEPSNVDYVIKSAVMTEGAFMVPVDVINNKDNVAVKIIPSEVEVVFNCKLQEYEMIDVTDFKAVVDYNDLSEDYNLITTDVKILSDKVSSIRFSPQQIQILVMR